ncbi:MAG: bifunctional riboflavin kinase/FAD synthetase [Luteolibacter sp.]
MPIRLDSLDELAAQNGSLHLALGVFDGVHIGHQEVISRAVEAARADGGKSFVATFSPHPIRVIAPGKAPGALLATLDEKAELVKSYGVDGLLVIRFDEDFATMEAEDFVIKITEGDVKTIAVGEDWRFGAKRKGDIGMLRRIGEERGFRLEAVAPVMWDGERISSTRIRQAIRDGAFGAAEKMLGRKYEVSGRVIEGKKLGRELEFPTANIDPGDLQMPKDGVWSVDVAGIGRGVANLGVRPTVDGERKLLEVHVFDFDGDLYGKTLNISFLRYIRGEQKFSSVEELRAKIAQDVEDAKNG